MTIHIRTLETPAGNLSILEQSPTYAELLAEVDRLTQLLKPTEKPLDAEANMAVSAETARLAFHYWQTIEDEEHPYASGDKGYTAHELGLRRRRAHDTLMAQLIREGYKFSYREDVTAWTQKFVRWFRDE